MTDTTKSTGRKTIRPTFTPRELMTDTPDLAGAWTAQIITLFPQAFPGVLGESLMGKALKDGLWQLQTFDLRDYGIGKHKNVDDTPAGGGAGVDERILEHFGIQEVSLGDFVMTGGELAAQALIDATVRLLPGVLGNADSTIEESFSNGLLEHPQYTKPAQWQDREIPDVLLSGNHKKIAAWRQDQSEEITKARRPDLWDAHEARLKNDKAPQD